MDDSVPDGFARHFRRSDVTDPWEPIYSRVTERSVRLGLRAADPHLNSRGLVHGAVMTALADNAMGLSCAKVRGDAARLMTVSLTIDFLTAATAGQWIEVDTAFVKSGGRLCFAQCFVTADGTPCARASGTFAVSARTSDTVRESPKP
jgi:uncharacterized protein (TIGR00369 family)